MFNPFKSKKSSRSSHAQSPPMFIESGGQRVGVAFQVDDVKRDGSTPKMTDDVWERRLDLEPIVTSHETETIENVWGRNGIVDAVHVAFSEHRALTLTPDMIWLTIAQGFANHVNANAGALRERLVPHEGKRTITVTTLSMAREEWGPIVSQFVDGIAKDIGPGMPRLFTNDFSTTTDVARVASQIVMLDAYKKYYDYELIGICGIPSVRLLGTTEDWQSIVDRVRVLAEYDLSWWTNALLPICESLVQTASGNVDRKFWQQIYKPKEAYGGDQATGWITNLFPYLHDEPTSRAGTKNYLLEMEVDKRTPEHGISIGMFPSTLSSVPFEIKYQDGSSRRHELLGGIVGAGYDTESQSVVPEVAWAVAPVSEFDKLIHELGEAYGWTPRLDLVGFELKNGSAISVALETEYLDAAKTESFTFYTDYKTEEHAGITVRQMRSGRVQMGERMAYCLFLGAYDDGQVVGLVRHYVEGETTREYVVGYLDGDEMPAPETKFRSDEAFLRSLLPQ